MITQHHYLYGDRKPEHGSYSLSASLEEAEEDLKKFCEDHPDDGILVASLGVRPSPVNLRPQYGFEFTLWDGSTLYSTGYWLAQEPKEYKKLTHEQRVKQMGFFSMLARMMGEIK